MWTISGPFDGEVGGELNFQKSKLLKTDTVYPLGRKDQPLVIGSKKISHQHCQFIVGAYSTDDVPNPLKKPKLEFMNMKDKPMKLLRGEIQMLANPEGPLALEDGDMINIIAGTTLIVKWEPICCYSQTRGKFPFPPQVCASLGINFVQIPSAHVTHHLTSTYSATLSIATSLLSACQFVKPEWLHEIIRIGTLPRNNEPSTGISLEDNFSLPLISKFRPTFSSTLPPSQKLFKIWEPNEERLNMFQGYRFICAGEKAREIDTDLRDLLTRGGGTIETFDVQGGVSKLHKALTRGRAKEGKGVIIVGDQKLIQTAVGDEGWNELLAEAKTFDLYFVNVEHLLHVVLEVDVSALENPPADAVANDTSTASLPKQNTCSNEFSPSTEEPQPNTIPRRLTRRVTSRQSSQEPTRTPDVEEVEPPRPRRALTRRVNAGVPLLTGLDDPSSILESAPDLTEMKAPIGPVIDLTAPTPARSRLKRRVGATPNPETQFTLESMSFSVDTDSRNEPPLKKFKALFDASHPDYVGTASIEDSQTHAQSGALGNLSQTQSQSGSTLKGQPVQSNTLSLGVVLEEEEEPSQTQPPNVVSEQRGKKRTLDGVDVDTDLVQGPVAKKVAIQNANAVVKAKSTISQNKPVSKRATSKPPSSAGVATSDAASRKMDTDAEFLKAIASTKRGKKTEDDFDREFNKLKISKPEINREEQEEQEEQWNVLADFGDDTGLRGNFMVVVEIDIHRKDGSQRQSMTPQLEGRPNFKKFKKTRSAGTRTHNIELFVSEENDYGMGAAYWKSGASQSQSQSQQDFAPSQKQTQAKTAPRAESLKPVTNTKPQKRQLVVLEDTDEEEIVPKKRSKPPSRADSAGASKRMSSRTKPAPKAKPLFLDSDDDVDDENLPTAVEVVDVEETLRSSASTNAPAVRKNLRAKKVVPTVVDDDSDDDAVFKGFKGAKKR